MKIVNPIGRIIDTGIEAKYSLRACICSDTTTNFSSNRTGGHCPSSCGCNCISNITNNSNRTAAQLANRVV